MKVEAHIVILLKRVHQLEKIVEHLITIVADNRTKLISGVAHFNIDEMVQESMRKIVNAGVPFDPNCNNCKTELDIINQGTDWESFNCPNCEAWYFPKVG